MDINVWDKCNNNCLMCTNPDWPWPAWDKSFNYDYNSLIKRVKKAEKKIKSGDSIYLTGGEPTLHPSFLKFFKYIKGNFPDQRIKLLTNGRKFFYSDFAQKVLKINNNFDVCVSLYGPTAKIHNAVTRTAGSFEQTIRGIKNLLLYKNKQIIEIRFVITRFSYQSLGEIFKTIKKRLGAIDRLILIFPEIESQAIKNLENIKISYSQLRPHLEKIKPTDNIGELRFYHFPLCTIPEKFWPYAWRTMNPGDTNFIKCCDECQFKKYCLGVPNGYLENVGNNDFSFPRKKIKIISSDNFYSPIKRIEQ